jgi:hypothetical protein
MKQSPPELANDEIEMELDGDGFAKGANWQASVSRVNSEPAPAPNTARSYDCYSVSSSREELATNDRWSKREGVLWM